KAGVTRWEICASELFSASVEAMDGDIHVVERSIERSLGIRVLDGGIGFAALTEPTDAEIADGIAEALAEAGRARKAALDDFAAPASGPRPQVELFDPRPT